MEIEEFAIERIQSLYENTVEFNLSDSGVHPLCLNDLLSDAEMRELQALALGYGWTNGAVSLLNADDEIVVFTPNYLQIWGWARALGVNVKAVQHHGDADWQPRLAELEEVRLDRHPHPGTSLHAGFSGKGVGGCYPVCLYHQ